MIRQQNPRLGILLMVATCAVFAVQDGVSRYLAENNNVYMIIMLRYWFFGLFVLSMAVRFPGGLRAAAGTAFPVLQILRGLVLVAEISLFLFALVYLGLIETSAVFIAYPLLIAALSGPVLGERVGWRRWAAIGAGFIGVIIILNPGASVFSPWALLPFICALLFALYSLLTRYVARKDPSHVSFFWTGLIGAVAITPLGLANWQSMSYSDWALVGVLCAIAMFSHWLLILVYEVADASSVQPFAYFQLPFASIIGLLFFDEVLRLNVAAGAAIVVATGLFTLWRERVRERQSGKNA